MDRQGPGLMGDILFLAHRIPYPPNRGDKIRSFNILKQLCALGTVHLATFADDDADMGHAETLRPMLGSLHIEKRTVSTPVGAAKALLTGKPVSLTMFDSPGIRRFVHGTLDAQSVNAVFVFSGQMAQFVPDLPTGTRFVIDFCDVDSAKFAAYAENSKAVFRYMHTREARLLSAFEQRIARRADKSVFVSSAEADVFQQSAAIDADRIMALENGIDCTFFDPAAEFEKVDTPAESLIVFTGQMDYRPNIEAVASFADKVFPAIRAQKPKAQFAIVGRNPTSEVTRMGDRDGVIVTGGVADIRSWLAAADIVVAPLRIARGIQNKVLEAMAMARPVVASKAAFEGIDARPGEHLMVADSPAQEAQHVLALLADPGRAETMGQAARRHMLDRYVWSETLAPIGKLIGMEASPHDDAAPALVD